MNKSKVRQEIEEAEDHLQVAKEGLDEKDVKIMENEKPTGVKGDPIVNINW